MRGRPLATGSLAVILAASGFGLLGVLSRFSYDAGLDPVSFVAWRALFGLVVIAVVVAIRLRRGVAIVDLRRLPARDALGLFAVALAGLGLNVAMFVAFDLAAIAVVLLAFYTYPALVAAVEISRGHERLDAVASAALLLALAGMVLVVGGGLSSDPATSVHPLGIALGLAGGVCQTAFVILSRGRYRSVPPEQATGWIILVIAIASAAASLVAGGALGVPLGSGRALVLVAVAGVISAGIPTMLFLVGIRAIGGTRAGILMLIEPVVGVTLAALVLGEALRPLQAVGGGAILIAASLLQRARPGAPAGVPLEALEPAAVPASEGT
ncbi:MAG TPA: DMT family transporter [Candidatus Limnocylindrales bacterium]|nr:DMT family transporter [Candidatus Limnocylindrales bacterium]